MEKNVQKISLPLILIFVIVFIVLSISFYYVYNAIRASNMNEAFYFLLLAAIGIGVSSYILYNIRKRTLSQKPQPRVVTTIECKKCGFKSLRQFEKGDHVFKSVGSCQKCNEPLLVTTIYAEERKK